MLSQFGLALANLALDLHLENIEGELAIRYSNNMLLDETKEGDPPWNPRMRTHDEVTTQDLPNQSCDVGGQLIHLKGEIARERGGTHRRDVTGAELRLSGPFALVHEGAHPTVLLKTGVVPVLHQDHEVDSDVELDAHGWKRDARGDPVELGGDQLSSGLLCLEHGQGKDEGDDE